jgi:hypothetical protein
MACGCPRGSRSPCAHRLRPAGAAAPAALRACGRASAAARHGHRRGWGADSLVRVDPLRLRLLRGRSVIVGTAGSWSYSPDGALLAVAARRDKASDRLRFVDVRRMRMVPPAISVGAIVVGLAWVEPSRLILITQNCCAGENGLVVVDPETRRVVSRAALPRRVIAVGRASGARVVLLEAPGDSIGTASLAIVAADGGIRRVSLERIAAGSDWSDDSEATPIGRWVLPGLALDPAGHAYVVGPDRVVRRSRPRFS